jgi:hypothetical protein
MLRVALGQEVWGALGAHYRRGTGKHQKWSSGYEPGNARTVQGLPYADGIDAHLGLLMVTCTGRPTTYALAFLGSTPARE